MTATFRSKQFKMHNILFKRIVPFLVALFLGVSISVLFIYVNRNKTEAPKTEVSSKNTLPIKEETGFAACSGIINLQTSQQTRWSEKHKTSYNSQLSISAKPRATYTAEAREANISGTIRLRVTFSASGRITSVSAVKGLPHGLTEQAITVARGIRFEPEIKAGKPVSVTKVVEYNFQIY